MAEEKNKTPPFTEDEVNKIVDQLDDDFEETKVFYEVWFLGYDGNHKITDFAEFVAMSDNKNEMVEFAKTIDTAKKVKEQLTEIPPTEVKYILITVEMTVEVEDSTEAIDVVYENEIKMEEN